MSTKSNSQPRRRLLNLAVLMALGCGALEPASASAATLTWNCTSNFWYNAACWNPNGTPTSADAVNVYSVGGGNTSLTIDDWTGTANAGSIMLDASAGTTVNLYQGGGSLLTGYEAIGLNGAGAFTQGGGTHTVSSYLALGYNSGSNGTYDLSGTGSLSANSEYIGYGGTGTFTQSGGTNTGSSRLYLGYNGASSGSYNLSAGSLSAGSEYIGYLGTGAFTQSGGTHTVNSLTLGQYAGGNGSYALSGNGSLSAYNEDIGSYGTGTFTQSGGTHTVRNLYLGYSGSGSGSYNLSAGSLTAYYETIGNYDTGAFTQSGGTHTVSNALYLGSVYGTYSGNGTYNLSAGSLTAGSETIGGGGYSGTGAFNQSGGTNTAGYLSLGGGFYSSGSYNLSAGSLTVGYDEFIGGGYAGTGAFTQSGGTHTVNGALTLGSYSLYSSGTYTMNGGTLNVGGNIVDGGAGSSTFNLDGGTLNVTGSSIALDNFNIGNASGSNGSFTLGSGQTLAAKNETIGYNGTGALTQNGGTNTVTGAMTIAANAGSFGAYTLTGGTLAVGSGITNNAGGSFFAGAGTTTTAGGTGFVNHGLLGGGGTIIGNVTSDGAVGPGNSPGVLSIIGNYTQSALGTYAVELGGGVAETQYDVLNVSGTAFLDGMLNVSLFDLGGGLFTPHAGDTFDILAADTLFGSFSSLSFAALSDPSLFWQLDYLTDAIGTTDVVRLSVAQAYTPATPVPEPETYVMLLAGLGLMGFMARRRKSATA